jgi:hypothetical protein
MTEHTSNPTCANCHKLMDAVGFGLERFDAVGARRDQLTLEFRGAQETEDGKTRRAPRTVTIPFDTAANVAGIPDSQFNSPAELGAILAKSPQCQECVVKQYFRYTAGRMDAAADRPLIRRVTDDFRKSGFRFEELIIALTVQREFPSEGGTAHVADNHQPR